MSNILVSGSSGGLGAYLAGQFGSNIDCFDRSNGRPRLGVPVDGYELIIHTAFGMPDQQESERCYIDSQVALVNSLLSLPCKRFVFISSIDVLNKGSNLSLYGKAKSEVEAVVRDVAHSLILRPGALLGSGMRASQIVKVARGDDVALTLSNSSTFSLVFYEDVLTAINSRLKGIYALVANRIVSLNEIALSFNKKPQWGAHMYSTVSEPFDCSIYRNEAMVSVDPIERLARFIERRGWV